MRVTRVHVPGPIAPGADVTLPAQAGEHLWRVLRLSPGAPVTLFDGTGGEYPATLLEREGRLVKARVLAHHAIERESPVSITLLQGIARGERMDLIVQKATELGVARIVPVLTERSVVRIEVKQRARKRDHWQAIATSACEQCGRNRLPDIGEPIGLDAAIGALLADATRCLLALDGVVPLRTAVDGATTRPIVLLIGPEGGLADAEQSHALSRGFTACRMGPRILRTETAGLTALAVIQAIAGDLGS